jgi:hypothetical protein
MRSLTVALAAFFSAGVAASPVMAAERAYPIEGFTGVAVSAGVLAEIRVQPGFSVRAVGETEDLERLRVERNGDRLEIGRKRSGFNWGRRERVTVFVTLPTLKAIDVSSGAAATAAAVSVNELSIEASSGGAVTITGVCVKLEADVSSGGSIEAEGLKCKFVTAEASSGGAMSVFASESLLASASSGAAIRVRGKPRDVRAERSSGAVVRITE